ncbi:hypothetical protein TRSC58_07546 [Trypanosoma rangeli SC58]|uniref:Uncharacterized protein n=1 Tax=Trypanosoma rangeli SC58 TaxID=429131 RepID=A0A061IRK4_TRYRA|nr:hypothetical protein TRSC58_07546 [Trypanosoma rangeli SC58]
MTEWCDGSPHGYLLTHVCVPPAPTPSPPPRTFTHGDCSGRERERKRVRVGVHSPITHQRRPIISSQNYTYHAPPPPFFS